MKKEKQRLEDDGKVWWLSGTHNTVWQGMVVVRDTQYCMARYGGVSDT